jgi:hypothetical protein
MKVKIIGGIIAAVFLIGAVGSILVMTSKPKNTVRIVSDSEVLYTIDLSTAEDDTFVIEKNGQHNTVEIKDHMIRVSEADCPDKTCVKSGWLSSSAMPIVCLPNRLVIEFSDEESEVDALAR